MFTKLRSALATAAEGLGLHNVETGMADYGGGGGGAGGRRPKYAYSRPAFLQLNTDDEIAAAGDCALRPIIVPRDIARMPWMSGYAEAVNAGKSRFNEDNGCVFVADLCHDTISPSSPPPDSASSCPSPMADPASHDQTDCQSVLHSNDISHVTDKVEACSAGAGDAPPPLQSSSASDSSLSAPSGCRKLRYFYFALFDGHAGHGASTAAAQQLHRILHRKLERIVDHLLPPDQPLSDTVHKPNSTFMWIPAQELAIEQLIVGALESSFYDMDASIATDRVQYEMRGGCTALVALFLAGRLYLANAGDSRAVVCRDGRVLHATHDFTPETEHQRIQQLACQCPHLLGDEFTNVDFRRRLTRHDLGRSLLCRQPHMTGWAYKTVTEPDLRFPLICGEGKRSRVCATIGVTRGFGDHDLRAHSTSVRIKPFLSSQPQVLVIDLSGANNSDSNSTSDSVSYSDCLVLATDGLWDVLASEAVALRVSQSLAQFPEHTANSLRYRYTSAAQELVMAARGKLKDGVWRLPDGANSTIDDISVFVVPLLPYKLHHQRETEENCRLQNAAAAAAAAAADVGVKTGTVGGAAAAVTSADLLVSNGRVSPPLSSATATSASCVNGTSVTRPHSPLSNPCLRPTAAAATPAAAAVCQQADGDELPPPTAAAPQIATDDWSPVSGDQSVGDAGHHSGDSTHHSTAPVELNIATSLSDTSSV